METVGCSDFMSSSGTNHKIIRKSFFFFFFFFLQYIPRLLFGKHDKSLIKSKNEIPAYIFSKKFHPILIVYFIYLFCYCSLDPFRTNLSVYQNVTYCLVKKNKTKQKKQNHQTNTRLVCTHLNDFVFLLRYK